MTERTTEQDDCPGAGRCHGSLAWCDRCGDVSRVCDAARCDRHRCQECNEIRPPEEREHWVYVCDVCEPPAPIARLLQYREAARTLAHNLSVAGFGALMWRSGDNHGFHMGADESQCTCQWAPGRGEPYRPSSRCEQEDDSEDDQRAGCVLGERCLAADPFHTSDECFDAEMAEQMLMTLLLATLGVFTLSNNEVWVAPKEALVA